MAKNRKYDRTKGRVIREARVQRCEGMKEESGGKKADQF